MRGVLGAGGAGAGSAGWRQDQAGADHREAIEPLGVDQPAGEPRVSGTRRKSIGTITVASAWRSACVMQ